jgi:xanthine dehydrogenase accessory factor
VGTALIIAQALADAERGHACVLVTVARVAGSVPREVGARMLVRAKDIVDTVGGGQLEYRAIEIARAMTQQSDAPARLERFPLSARVGQCCGGTVWLALERVDAVTAQSLRMAHAAMQRGETFTRQVNASAQEGFAQWIDVMRDDTPQIVLFGAGHVGHAIAQALAVTDVSLTWIDSRDAQFPVDVASPIVCIESDDPVAEVRALPQHAHCIVMTHSHALDFEIINALLKANHAGFIGLIGSKTKRAQFEARLRALGHADGALATVRCPIGLPSLRNKHPGTIAIAVVAELLAYLEQNAHALSTS